MSNPSKNLFRLVVVIALVIFGLPKISHGFKIRIVPMNLITPAKFGDLYNAGKFDSMASLFLYPKNQSAKSHADDSMMFNSIFRSMHNQWGEITNLEKSNGPTPKNVAARFGAGDSASILDNIKACNDTTFIKVEYKNRNQFILGFIQCRQGDKFAIGILDFIRDISNDPRQSRKQERDFQNQINAVLNSAGQGDMK